MTDPIDHLRAALADRYVIERLLGEGGMATVYLARDTRHEREVAVKILRPELAASLGADRFLREIKVAARLQHPNILALYDSGEAEGFLYYVMPFVQGESLRDRLNREQQLPIEEAVQITCQVADALQHAHSHGIIHRDIKPENILLQGGHALVADFGIAKAVSSGAPVAAGVGPAARSTLTQAGTAVGTPYYMSPEQAAGGEHLDGRTDQYSLACVLYEMLIGQPPFTGPNAMAILARHSMETVPSIQVVRHSVPDEVEDAIMRALEKTPADRFPTMQEFADLLAQADLGPTTRRTTSRGVPIRRTTPRGTTTVGRRSAPHAARATWWSSSRRRWLVSLGGVLLLVGIAWGVWRGFVRDSASGASGSTGLDPNRIAVLYFESTRGDSDSLSYLADGLTEALIHELSGVSGLQVISSNGVRRYKDTTASSQAISRDLGVGTLVNGTVAQSGDRLRVNVSLVDAGSGIEIASNTLERPRTEIFALQDDVAKEVAIFLRQRLGQEIRVRESRTGTRNAQAWELVQQAAQVTKDLHLLQSGGDTAAAARRLRQADSLLAIAETKDPTWVAPTVQRGWLAYRQSRLAGAFAKSYYAEWIDRGTEFADKALARRPNDADPLELRGTLRYWRWLLNLVPGAEQSARLLAGAEEDLRASVAANPSQASAWTSLSHLLLTRGEVAEGKLAALKAYEADPYLTTVNLTLWRLFTTSVDLDDHREASHWCAEGTRRFPDDPRFVECQIRLFALKEQPPNVPHAWELLERYEQLTPPNQREFRRRYGELLVAIALARAGLKDSARAVAVRARADASIDPTRELVYNEVLLRSVLDDRDEALRLLGTFLATNPQMRTAVARDQSWWFNNLRADSRFQALVGMPD